MKHEYEILQHHQLSDDPVSKSTITGYKRAGEYLTQTKMFIQIETVICMHMLYLE